MRQLKLQLFDRIELCELLLWLLLVNNRWEVVFQTELWWSGISRMTVSVRSTLYCCAATCLCLLHLVIVNAQPDPLTSTTSSSVTANVTLTPQIRSPSSRRGFCCNWHYTACYQFSYFCHWSSTWSFFRWLSAVWECSGLVVCVVQWMFLHSSQSILQRMHSFENMKA